ncbi:Hypothetical predicted protein [Mytilus galloprovincialis]|uniref:Mab-21-like nucleotidyltransferase domain-containing protein n=1 Tax=Mytilus galloprovincialis TaxID=29158 RepID=A0A8B6BRR7_MYTGA|nr:Hypothetical predicted protein [Mytilus galloprovincialis]
MNQNLRNDEKDNEQNVHGLRKITYWGKYGIKRFPYRGSRRYSPGVYQSEDGGIIISNDVFGLTIRQFERRFNACLERRKAQEQYISNLRYPDKTSNEYMEYLHDSTDYDLLWRGNNSQEKVLYELIVRTIGTEIDIRKRQQLCITEDMIKNSSESGYTRIWSGSLAEGLNLPGSDIDYICVVKGTDVIRDLRNIKHQIQRTTLLMETDTDHPGFCKLRLIAGRSGKKNFLTYDYFESTKNSLYLSVGKFVSNILKLVPNLNEQPPTHGPCLSNREQTIDCACCLRSKYFPYNAIPWASRYRQQWPPNSAIENIITYGYLLVPIGPKDVSNCNVLWRLSFSVAEKQLVHSFNIPQLLCYGLIKLILKHIVNTKKHAEGLLCS